MFSKELFSSLLLCPVTASQTDARRTMLSFTKLWIWVCLENFTLKNPVNNYRYLSLSLYPNYLPLKILWWKRRFGRILPARFGNLGSGVKTSAPGVWALAAF